MLNSPMSLRHRAFSLVSRALALPVVQKDLTIGSGDNVTMIVELGKPVALAMGSHFAIREGGRTVGSGVVTEVLD